MGWDALRFSSASRSERAVLVLKHEERKVSRVGMMSVGGGAAKVGAVMLLGQVVRRWPGILQTLQQWEALGEVSYVLLRPYVLLGQLGDRWPGMLQTLQQAVLRMAY